MLKDKTSTPILTLLYKLECDAFTAKNQLHDNMKYANKCVDLSEIDTTSIILELVAVKLK